MALKKSDLLLLLTEMQDQGIEVTSQIRQLVNSTSIPIDILKFINERRLLEITRFYEHMRKNYNAKKSDLYINIVKEVRDPQEVLTTLSALLTQILLWSRKLDDKQLFLEHSRAREISGVLTNYFKTYDLTQAMQLLKLIKADLVALEHVTGHRT
jgi:hypothetical protein